MGRANPRPSRKTVHVGSFLSAHLGNIPAWRRLWVLTRTEPLLRIPEPLLFLRARRLLSWVDL